MGRILAQLAQLLEESTPLHIESLDPERVLLMGDVHGSIAQVRRALDVAEANDVSVVVQLGDFGVWPGEQGRQYIADVVAELERRQIWLLFVDGNHEDFNQLYDIPVDQDDGTRPLGPFLAHLPRGLRWTWRGLRFAAMGGAHSVDRQMRVEDVSWWPEEWVSDPELELLKEGGQVDVLLMHDSPSGAPNSIVDDPLNPGARFFPQEDLYEAAIHRRRLAYAVNPVEPAWIFHGHYHKYMSGTYTPAGASRPCNVIGLDEGGTTYTDDFVRVVKLDELLSSDGFFGSKEAE